MEISFSNIDFFENHVLKENKKKPQYYILNPNYKSKDPYGIFLSHLSIFDKKRGTVEKDKETINEILKILMTNKPPKEKEQLLEPFKLEQKEKRAIGSMLGMAIGDSMGARYEFQEVRYGKQDLFDMGNSSVSNFGLEPGQWTDDTSMGLCLADSLLMNNGTLDQHDLMHRFLCWWKGGYNNGFRYNQYPRHSVRLGGNISKSFFYYAKDREPETKAGDRNTSGNGSIMRNAAIPICFSYEKTLACKEARRQSLVTHKGDEAKECCSLLTHIIVKIFEGENLKKILNNLRKYFHSDDVPSVDCLAKYMKEGGDINRDWDWTVPQYRYSPERTKMHPGYIGSYSMDNMAMSLNTIYNTNSFKEALIRVVNIRGDSDSVASVVGQIAGAFYPIEEIPGDWIKAVYNWDKGEIALRGYMLARLKDRKSFIVEK